MKLAELIRSIYYSIDQAPNCILITDANGIILFVNKALCQLTGYEPKEVLGKMPHFFMAKQNAPERYKNLWETISKGGIWCGDFHNQRKNGETYWERSIIIPILSPSNEISYFIYIREEITDVKCHELRQKQLQKNMMQDLRMANFVQKSFLPADMENDAFRLKIFFEAQNEVSGDHFDYIWNEKRNTLTGYILDVMGHGVAAALQGSSLRIVGRKLLHSKMSIEKRIRHLNKISLSALVGDSFAGIIMFEADFNHKELYYVTAGINYFLSQTKGRTSVVKGSGMFLGLSPEAEYQKHRIPFQSGDCFCFMSDGLFDGLSRDTMRASDLEAAFHQITKTPQNNIVRKDDATACCIAIK